MISLNLKIPLCLVPIQNKYLDHNFNETKLGLNGEVQYINSSLALQISKYWMDKFSKKKTYIQYYH